MTRRLIKAVGAINAREVQSILDCDSTKRMCDVVDISIMRNYPERFPWKNDSKAMAIVEEEVNSGPFNSVVLFFVEE